jgi:putative FmdB family regulatory protein
MPTYQYACTDAECGNRFELVQKVTDPAATECPVCEGPVRKVYSSVGVVFKGSGFYRTDSRAEARSGRDSRSGSSGQAEAESKSSAKSESKSDAKPESGGSSSTSSGSASSPAKAASSPA